MGNLYEDVPFLTVVMYFVLTIKIVIISSNELMVLYACNQLVFVSSFSGDDFAHVFYIIIAMH